MKVGKFIKHVSITAESVELKVDRGDGIIVECTDTSKGIRPGDLLSHHGDHILWTPRANQFKVCKHVDHDTCFKSGVDYDIRINAL